MAVGQCQDFLIHDRIEEAASVEDPKDLYPAQLSVFLDPNDVAVQEAARAEGIGMALIPEDRKTEGLFLRLDGRFNVSYADVQAVAAPALRHRIILNFEGEAEGISTDSVVRAIIAETPVEPAD